MFAVVAAPDTGDAADVAPLKSRNQTYGES